MKLRDYMRDNGLSDEAIASAVGGCSVSAVKKWKYGERIPGAARILKLDQISGGKVTLADWAVQATKKRSQALETATTVSP